MQDAQDEKREPDDECHTADHSAGHIGDSGPERLIVTLLLKS
jgi:hypothetical protein